MAKPELEREKRGVEEQTEFLLQGSMEGQYLGACLDSCRWGSMQAVMYEMDVKGLIGFMQNWMEQNENFEELWVDDTERYKRIELPYVDHGNCPISPHHKSTMTDCGGRVRCAHPIRRGDLSGVCYEIITENKERTMPLEVMLQRLGHTGRGLFYKNNLIFPFDGWTLAAYMQKWYVQEDRKALEESAAK